MLLFCGCWFPDRPRDSRNSFSREIPLKSSIFLSIRRTRTSLEIKLIDPMNSVSPLTRGNAARKAAVLVAKQFADDCQSTRSCQFFKWHHPTSQSRSSCLCVHSSTSSLSAPSPLISLRGSWFCTLDESPYAVKTVARVNLSVSQKNRLLGDITLLYLAAHWLGAVSLDPAASHFVPIYHRGTHPSSHMNRLFFS